MAKKITLDELAVMIKRGFDETAKKAEVDKRFDKVEARLGNVEQRLDHVDARLATIESDIKDIKEDVIRREEFEDLLARVKYIEKKIGIESGV